MKRILRRLGSCVNATSKNESLLSLTSAASYKKACQQNLARRVLRMSKRRKGACSATEQHCRPSDSSNTASAQAFLPQEAARLQLCRYEMRQSPPKAQMQQDQKGSPGPQPRMSLAFTAFQRGAWQLTVS